MKAKIILLACVALGIASCGKPHDHGEPKPDVKKGIHYFYVRNDLNEDVVLEFNTSKWDNHELSEKYQINEYYKVRAFKQDTTLVRVFDDSLYEIELEALNCFYYGTLFSADPRYTCIMDYGGYSSENLWKGEYWKYERLGKWEAKYTLTVDEKLLDSLFPSN